MELSLSFILVSPKSIQGGQTSPIMWLYNSIEDSIELDCGWERWSKDSLEGSCFEKNYQRTQILSRQERNLLAPTKEIIFDQGLTGI